MDSKALRAYAATSCVALALVLVARLFLRNDVRPASGGGLMRRATLEGHEVLWERPVKAPKAALLFLHGCTHSAGDLFPPSKTCPDCLGLPEELLIRQAALSRGLLIVAVSSADRAGRRCWDARPGLAGSADAALPAVVTRVLQQERLPGLPVYALGVSSGGAMALLLPGAMELAGVCAQIMAVPPALLQRASGGRRPPPTLFVHMPRDESTAALVAEDLATLAEGGTPAAQIAVPPRAVTADFLVVHAPHVFSRGHAEDVVGALRRGGFLAPDFMLVGNPRRTLAAWQAAVEPHVGGISLVPDASPLTELLNLAWAGHEIVADQINASLAWLESGGTRSIESLVERQFLEDG